MALAAYTAPTAIGTLVFGRFLRGRDSLEVASGDAILRTGALAGLIVLWGGAATVIAVDAATFAVLAVTYRLAMLRRRTIDTPRLNRRQRRAPAGSQ